MDTTTLPPAARSTERRPTTVLHWLFCAVAAAFEVLGTWFAMALIYFGQASCGYPVNRVDMHEGQVALGVLALVVAVPWLLAGGLTHWRLPVVLGGLVCTGYAVFLAIQGLQLEPWSHGFCF